MDHGDHAGEPGLQSHQPPLKNPENSTLAKKKGITEKKRSEKKGVKKKRSEKKQQRRKKKEAAPPPPPKKNMSSIVLKIYGIDAPGSCHGVKFWSNMAHHHPVTYIPLSGVSPQGVTVTLPISQWGLSRLSRYPPRLIFTAYTAERSPQSQAIEELYSGNLPLTPELEGANTRELVFECQRIGGFFTQVEGSTFHPQSLSPIRVTIRASLGYQKWKPPLSPPSAPMIAFEDCLAAWNRAYAETGLQPVDDKISQRARSHCLVFAGGMICGNPEKAFYAELGTPFAGEFLDRILAFSNATLGAGIDGVRLFQILAGLICGFVPYISDMDFSTGQVIEVDSANHPFETGKGDCEDFTKLVACLWASLPRWQGCPAGLKAVWGDPATQFRCAYGLYSMSPPNIFAPATAHAFALIQSRGQWHLVDGTIPSDSGLIAELDPFQLHEQYPKIRWGISDRGKHGHFYTVYRAFDLQGRCHIPCLGDKYGVGFMALDGASWHQFDLGVTGDVGLTHPIEPIDLQWKGVDYQSMGPHPPSRPNVLERPQIKDAGKGSATAVWGVSSRALPNDGVITTYELGMASMKLYLHVIPAQAFMSK